MSTRTQVRIIENRHHVDLYHHCDGYFEGVGSELKHTLSKFKDVAGILEHLVNEYDGYELTDCLHSDINYYYLIDLDNKVFKGFALHFPAWLKDASFDYLQPSPNSNGAEMDLVTGDITDDTGRLVKTIQ